MKTIDRALLGFGILIPFWLFLGVALTARAYPGYSHLDQAMSQLGAVGAPTHSFSAWVNNFPLGVMFVLFAIGVARRFKASPMALLSAALIFIHGLASFTAGYFSCDQGCAPVQPSVSQQSHNLAGLVMFISLTLAGALWTFLGKSLLSSARFAMFSAICVVLAIVTVMLMATALADGHLFGLYQRLNYGVSVVWIASLAVAALQGEVDVKAAYVR
ncbi:MULTISPECIES: DUF998 domain-containing protein [Pseudomonas]|jgi:hypothetical membrane protein|uniref:DUF998 domain-containing protein n=1 Tax=Pseudomonas brassicacearum (strain NFM421) TaxID=994484 RepID=F2KFV9_PSEBN|nr:MULTISPECIES: DUF998 domain-containing protein [Pseudomonas]KIR16224.1 hypothetical protein PFLU4_29230 [Pseudomonas fluorescens]AEA68855.1 Conserved hypothetical protein; putative membrane protein [Pseudomonas brassicacearum subsp. brassicacearum NFM421]AOS37827.1 hypothetical protein A0U95_03375 [Pseudomonas brassicacearum]PJH88317.1 DUF998 domain-containing protein [Pseudomonas sp. WCS365]RDI07402.1 uncharacterized protein DUF998 [Pseudomonas fluorescens]